MSFFPYFRLHIYTVEVLCDRKVAREFAVLSFDSTRSKLCGWMCEHHK